MNKEVVHGLMCAEGKPERPLEKPPVEKPIREGGKTPGRIYPEMEPPEPWPEPSPPKPDKTERK